MQKYGKEAVGYRSSSLEAQLAALGLEPEDAEYPEGGGLDKTTIQKVEAARVLSRKLMDRDRIKQEMLTSEREKRCKAFKARQKKQQNWEKRLQKSPFLVDLLGEQERIDEENRVRLQQEYARQKEAESRKERAKNEIVLKALTENSDLDALRREKRAIQEEEKRLKALLDIEKTKAHRKQDLLAAQLAERHRKATKSEYRRKNFQDALTKHLEEESAALREKLDVMPRPSSTFDEYDSHNFMNFG